MFVESTFFFSDTGKLLMWFLLFKFKRLSLWEEKMKKAQQKKKGCNLLSENLKLQVQKRDKQLCFFSGFAFFFFFLPKHAFIQHKNLPPMKNDISNVAAAPGKEPYEACCQRWLQPLQPPQTSSKSVLFL